MRAYIRPDGVDRIGARLVITYKGITRSIAEWAEVLGISKGTLYDRIYAAMPVEKILSPQSYASHRKPLKEPNRDDRVKATICWACKHAVPTSDGLRGCSWSRTHRPVEGWEATPTEVDIYTSYLVTSCPEFERG